MRRRRVHVKVGALGPSVIVGTVHDFVVVVISARLIHSCQLLCNIKDTDLQKTLRSASSPGCQWYAVPAAVDRYLWLHSTQQQTRRSAVEGQDRRY